MSSSDSRDNPTNNMEATPYSRGRQLNRSSIPMERELHPSPISVPLRFIHVPNSHRLTNTNRTPSVPDFASFYHHHYNNNQPRMTPQHEQIHQHLSGEVLRNADAAAEQMEQFEERLRRAQLTVLRDRDLEVATRIRSRSTPSRGASRQMRSEEEMRRRALWLQHVVSDEDDNHEPEAKQEESNVAPALHHQSAEINQIGLHYQSADSDFEQTMSPENVQSSLPAAPTTPSLEVERSQSNEETVTSPLQNQNPSSVSSSSPLLDTHGIPRPPPLPLPSSERERLVLREREARSETERARRRHLALLRERQLDSSSAMDREESGDAYIRNNRPTSVGSLDFVELVGNYSHDNYIGVENEVPSSPDDRIHPSHLMEGVAGFHDIEHDLTHNLQVTEPEIPQSSPDNIMTNELRGNNALGLEYSDYGGAGNLLNRALSHTANSISIASVGSTSNRSGISPPPPLPPPSSERERLVLREREARIETARARRRHIALLREQDNSRDEEEGDVTANNSELLSAALIDEEEKYDEAAAVAQHNNWVMERFLETLGEEERNTLTADGLTADGNLALAADSTGLTYTMELFLSEVGDVVTRIITETEGVDTENDTPQHIQHDLGAVNQGSIPQHESISSNESDALLSENGITYVHSNESRISIDGSDEDLGARCLNTNSIQDFPNQFSQDRRSPAESSVDNAASLANNNSPSILQSIDDSSELSNSIPQIPRLTEADVAQLTDVDHASIGNAPPQSIRDEPSESSMDRAGAFRDLGFSVATQTTAIESVTETSESSIGEFNRGVVHQRSDIDEVIRVDGSIHNGLSSLRGSIASVEAMPSIDSVVDSDSDHSQILSDSSSSELHSSYSSDLESHLSSDGESQILPPTEALVVSMEEIEHASIGNVPPQSIRDEDEHLSESSILGRGHSYNGNIFVNPSAGLSLLDTVTANASVEAMPSVDSVHSMSQDSVDAMPSEYNGNSLNEDDNETGDEDLGSSTSIEALPSVDLGSEPEDDPFLNLAEYTVPNEPSTVSIHDGSNGTEDEDLLVYQASDDMASSTSIEALPSDDLGSDHGDVRSPNLIANNLDYGPTRLNGFNHNRYAQDNFVNNQNQSERCPLLPIRHEVRDAEAQGSQSDITKMLTPVLVSFVSGCFIGICVGIFLFSYGANSN